MAKNKTSSKWRMFGKRLLAFIIDRILVSIAFVILLAIPAVYIAASAIKAKNVLSLLSLLLWYIASLAILMLINLTYFIFMEYRYGFTIGKKVLNIAVIGADGKKAAFSGIVVRNLLKSVPFFGFFLCIDSIGIVTTDKQQRFTEILAETKVIEELH